MRPDAIGNMVKGVDPTRHRRSLTEEGRVDIEEAEHAPSGSSQQSATCQAGDPSIKAVPAVESALKVATLAEMPHNHCGQFALSLGRSYPLLVVATPKP